MNRNDVPTALCTQEGQSRLQWMRKTGFAGTVSQCDAPVPVNREALVVRRGGHEDIVRGGFVVPSEGPGLPPILQQPLPGGFLRTAAGVASPAAAPPAPPPSSAEGDPFDRYNALVSRAAKAKAALKPIEQRMNGQGRTLPADIFAARNRLDAQLQWAMSAFKTANRGDAEARLRDAESALATIEKFVAGR